jgi:hypothetical protein
LVAKSASSSLISFWRKITLPPCTQEHNSTYSKVLQRRTTMMNE